MKKTITSIAQQKKNKKRYSIFIDGEFAFGVSEDILIKYSLVKGLSFEEDYINEVLMAEEENYTFNLMLNILSFSPKTEKQIRDKMKEKGYDEKLIDKVVDKLIYYKYIDDYDYGLRFIQDKKKFKKIGKYKLKQELYSKGIKKDMIDQLIEETYDEEDEVDRALLLVEKKLTSSKIKDLEWRDKKQKLGLFLSSKGYSWDIINQVMLIVEEDLEI